MLLSNLLPINSHINTINQTWHTYVGNYHSIVKQLLIALNNHNYNVQSGSGHNLYLTND